MIITNSRYALVGYFITSYRTRAHGIIVKYGQKNNIKAAMKCTVHFDVQNYFFGALNLKTHLTSHIMSASPRATRIHSNLKPPCICQVAKG